MAADKQRNALPILADGEIGDQPFGHCWQRAARRQHCRFRDARTGTNRRLDFRQIDRVSTNLDSTAFTPKEVKIAFLIDTANIAGAIAPPARRKGIGGKGGGVELRPTPISGTDVRAGDDNLAHLVAVRCAAIVTPYQHTQPLRGLPDRKDAAGNAWAAMFDDVLRDNAGFGGGQMIDENAILLRMAPEEFDIAVEHGFAAEVDRS